MSSERRTWTRRRFLAGVGGCAAGGVLLEGLVLEPRRLSVRQHRIGATGPDAAATLRLVQLTDLHLKSVGRFEAEIAAAVADLEPNVILFSGDAVDRADALPLLEAFLASLPPRTARFATLGNWEYWSGVDLARLRAVYQSGGCRLLVNESASVTHQGRRAHIVGLDDLLGGAPDVRAAVGSTMQGPNVLLVSHCPAYRDLAPAMATRPVAMLSGHTHGGQVALGPWAPLRPPGSGDYVAGWYRDPDAGRPDLYVSRGLGTSVLPVRLGSVPEISCFDWSLSGSAP